MRSKPGDRRRTGWGMALAAALGAGVCLGSLGAGTAAAGQAKAAPLRATQPAAGDAAAKARPPLRKDERYPYGGPAFSALVADSYKGQPAGPADFYRWFENAYARGQHRIPGTGSKGLRDALAQAGSRIADIADPKQRSEEEIRVAAALHRVVKKGIPRFSLDRGFEFRNVVRYGERQCLLQSVLIAGLLQGMGANAGIAMVYQSAHGALSNLGHVVTLLRLPDGTDLIVDASDQQPFSPHRGLFLPCPGYRFLGPVYQAGSSRIRSYREASGKESVDAGRVRMLPYNYVRSQFFYYRGERVPGALLAQTPSPEALRSAEEHLRASVRYAPANPLAVYMLGRALLAEGKAGEAESQLADACRLYARYGWTPEGPNEFLTLSKGQASHR